METTSELPPGNGVARVGYHIVRARELRARTVGRGLSRLAALAIYPVRQLVRQLKEKARRRAMYRELAALDTHMLADIGITPADFDAIVDGSYEQDGTRISRRSAPAAAENVTWLHRPQPGIRSTETESAETNTARCA